MCVWCVVCVVVGGGGGQLVIRRRRRGEGEKRTECLKLRTTALCKQVVYSTGLVDLQA